MRAQASERLGLWVMSVPGFKYPSRHPAGSGVPSAESDAMSELPEETQRLNETDLTPTEGASAAQRKPAVPQRDRAPWVDPEAPEEPVDPEDPGDGGGV